MITWNTVFPQVLGQLSFNYKGIGCEIIGVFYVRGGRWEKGGGDHRSGDIRDNLFPHDRKGCLDKSILSKIGLDS